MMRKRMQVKANQEQVKAEAAEWEISILHRCRI